MEQIERPVDEKLFSLVEAVVNDYLTLIKRLEADGRHFGAYPHWPELSWNENGLPSFSEAILSGPTDYKEAFRPSWGLIGHESHKEINPRDVTSFKALLEYIRSQERLRKQAAADTSLFETHILLLCESLVDRYIHIYQVRDLDVGKFLSIYNPIEKFLYLNDLPVKVLVPILFLTAEFDELDIGVEAKILRLSDSQHLARAPKKTHAYGVHLFVQEAATHSFALINRSIPNENWLQVGNLISTSSAYPLTEIDTFFAAVRIFTGYATGYAQLLTEPVDWAADYTANLPSLEGLSVREYPMEFERGYWNEPIPAISKEDWKEIGGIYLKLMNLTRDGLNPRLSLAIRRVNQCFLRASDEDSVLDATIALEALLSDGSDEVTHKLAIRLAGLSKLGIGQPSPYTVFKKTKYIYSFRSAIAHGDVKKARKYREWSDGEEKKSTAEVAVELLRSAVKVLLDHPQYFDVAKIDQSLLIDTTLPIHHSDAPDQ